MEDDQVEEMIREECGALQQRGGMKEVDPPWSRRDFASHAPERFGLSSLMSRAAREVAWVTSGSITGNTLQRLSDQWKLHPLPVAEHGPVTGLGNIRVGLLDLDTPLSAGLVRLVEANPEVKWIALLSCEQLRQEAVRALIREHCYDFHTLPLDRQRLEITLGRAQGMAELEEHTEPAEPVWQDSEEMPIIGQSEPMMRLFRRLVRVAASNVPVLIQGESGTGKELAALAVHRNSRRAEGPFVAVNCGALPSQLIQSELFGHEPGAFTGAAKRKLGQLELAHKGTLLLDEVGDLSLDLQVNLLRFLQEGTLWRVGGMQPIQLDVRVVAATHVDLAEAVAEGHFREDLYYRLNVIQLDMPPLRERGAGDMKRLARFYLHRFRSRNPRLKGYSRSAMEAMCAHPWPGNVRELINRVQRGIAMAEGRLIRPEDMGFDPIKGEVLNQTLEEARCQAEKESVQKALHRSAYNVSQAARQLGIGRVTLYRLIHKHGIDLPDRS